MHSDFVNNSASIPLGMMQDGVSAKYSLTQKTQIPDFTIRKAKAFPLPDNEGLSKPL